MEKDLEESRSQYKALVESACAITWEFDIAADQMIDITKRKQTEASLLDSDVCRNDGLFAILR